MSAELTALLSLAANYNGGIFRLSPENLAVLFWTTNYIEKRNNWIDWTNPFDTVTDEEWDTIQAMTSDALRTIKMPIVGMITAYMSQDPPPNVLPCDGSEYLRVEYPDLYSVLDPFFITDVDHFVVPDLRGRTIIGAGTSLVLTARGVGDVGGEENHQLSVTELASHSHSIELTTGVPGVAPGEVAFDTTIPIIQDATGNTGGDTPHNNMPPFMALNYGVTAS